LDENLLKVLECLLFRTIYLSYSLWIDIVFFSQVM